MTAVKNGNSIIIYGTQTVGDVRRDRQIKKFLDLVRRPTVLVLFVGRIS